MTTSEAKAAIENMLASEHRREAAMALEEKWSGLFEKAIGPGGSVTGVAVPPREAIIGNWFRKGDLGFICGPRGLGKTWLAMMIARKCAEGAGFGGLAEWNINGQRRVLYVDGEMPWDAIRERDIALAATGAPGLFYLYTEDDPVDGVDPSGNQDNVEELTDEFGLSLFPVDSMSHGPPLLVGRWHADIILTMSLHLLCQEGPWRDAYGREATRKSNGSRSDWFRSLIESGVRTVESVVLSRGS